MVKDLSKLLRRQNKKSILNHEDTILVRQGREQFKKLIEKGIELPVVLL